MNIYNILENSYNTALTFSQVKLDYSKEEKERKLLKFSKFFERFLVGYDEKKKGDIFLSIHILGITLLLILYYIVPINKYTILSIIGLGAWQNITNKYFGQNGCILTRLERFYYKDNNWFGPVTFIILALNKEPTRFNVDLMIGIGSSITVMYYLYRLYRKFMN